MTRINLIWWQAIISLVILVLPTQINGAEPKLISRNPLQSNPILQRRTIKRCFRKVRKLRLPKSSDSLNGSGNAVPKNKPVYKTTKVKTKTYTFDGPVVTPTDSNHIIRTTTRTIKYTKSPVTTKYTVTSSSDEPSYTLESNPINSIESSSPLVDNNSPSTLNELPVIPTSNVPIYSETFKELKKSKSSVSKNKPTLTSKPPVYEVTKESEKPKPTVSKNKPTLTSKPPVYEVTKESDKPNPTVSKNKPTLTFKPTPTLTSKRPVYKETQKPEEPKITSKPTPTLTSKKPVYKPTQEPEKPKVTLKPKPPVYTAKPTSKPPVYTAKPTSKPPVYTAKPTPKPPVYTTKPAPKPPVYPTAPKYPVNTPGLNKEQMLKEVNEARALKGAPPLRISEKLSQIAQKHSVWQSKHGMNHQGDGGSRPCNRCAEGGYMPNSCGENVATGQTTTNQVMEQWIASPGHYKNIINPDYVDIGFGMVDNYWTQVFGMGEKAYSDGSIVVCPKLGGKYNVAPLPPNPSKYPTSNPGTTSNPGITSNPGFSFKAHLPKLKFNFNMGLPRKRKGVY